LTFQATPEEISNAYRRQSKLYHPDKHTDPVLKKEAEILFNRTKKAYEGLYHSLMLIFIHIFFSENYHYFRIIILLHYS